MDNLGNLLLAYFQFTLAQHSLNHIELSERWMLKRKINPLSMSMHQKEKMEMVLVSELCIALPLVPE